MNSIHPSFARNFPIKSIICCPLWGYSKVSPAISVIDCDASFPILLDYNGNPFTFTNTILIHSLDINWHISCSRSASANTGVGFSLTRSLLYGTAGIYPTDHLGINYTTHAPYNTDCLYQHSFHYDAAATAAEENVKVFQTISNMSLYDLPAGNKIWLNFAQYNGDLMNTMTTFSHLYIQIWYQEVGL